MSRIFRQSTFIAAITVMGAMTAAHAGFVDERKSQAPATGGPATGSAAKPAAPAASAVSEGSGWQGAAPAAAEGATVAAAIAALLPPDLPGVKIEAAPDVNMAASVTWPAGLSRAQALEHISSANGLVFDVKEGLISVRKSAPLAASATQAFEVTSADRNFRLVLRRWSQAAAWTFGDEYWKLPVDVPVAGSAALGPDFKAAVRQLMASTELTSHPGRPCFYSNKVLRIVPANEQCDRVKE